MRLKKKIFTFGMEINRHAFSWARRPFHAGFTPVSPKFLKCWSTMCCFHCDWTKQLLWGLVLRYSIENRSIIAKLNSMIVNFLDQETVRDFFFRGIEFSGGSNTSH